MVHQVKKRQSLEAASRVYSCSLDFFANPQSTRRIRRKSNSKRNPPQIGYVKPKKDEDLSSNQRERLQQLLTVYGEQSCKNFRKSATMNDNNNFKLPQIGSSNIHTNKRTMKTSESVNSNEVLPKLSGTDSPAKQNTTKSHEVHLPNIRE